MNIDNSGSSIVIDPKSQAAIDAVRDRITLLESENARLTRLKTVLDDSVRKAEADLAYKTDLLTDINTKIEVATTKLNETIVIEVEASNSVNELKERIATIQKDINEKEVAFTAKEKELNERESYMDDRAKAITNAENQLNAEWEAVNAKKVAIQELLTKL